MFKKFDLLDSDFVKYIGFIGSFIGLIAIIFSGFYKVFKLKIDEFLKNGNNSFLKYWLLVAKKPKNYQWHINLEKKLDKVFGEKFFSAKALKSTRNHTLIIAFLVGLFFYVIYSTKTNLNFENSSQFQTVFILLLGMPLSVFFYNVVFDYFTIAANRYLIKRMKNTSFLSIVALFMLCFVVSVLGAGLAVAFRVFFTNYFTSIFHKGKYSSDLLIILSVSSFLTSIVTLIYAISYMIFFLISNIINNILKFIDASSNNKFITKEPLIFFGTLFLMLILVLLFFIIS